MNVIPFLIELKTVRVTILNHKGGFLNDGGGPIKNRRNQMTRIEKGVVVRFTTWIKIRSFNRVFSAALFAFESNRGSETEGSIDNGLHSGIYQFTETVRDKKKLGDGNVIAERYHMQHGIIIGWEHIHIRIFFLTIVLLAAGRREDCR